MLLFIQGIVLLLTLCVASDLASSHDFLSHIKVSTSLPRWGPPLCHCEFDEVMPKKFSGPRQVKIVAVDPPAAPVPEMWLVDCFKLDCASHKAPVCAHRFYQCARSLHVTPLQKHWIDQYLAWEQTRAIGDASIAAYCRLGNNLANGLGQDACPFFLGLDVGIRG